MGEAPVIRASKAKGQFAFERLSPGETAAYTHDMLESLRKMADRQGQSLLAHFLHIAAIEADSQAKHSGR